MVFNDYMVFVVDDNFTIALKTLADHYNPRTCPYVKLVFDGDKGEQKEKKKRGEHIIWPSGLKESAEGYDQCKSLLWKVMRNFSQNWLDKDAAKKREKEEKAAKQAAKNRASKAMRTKNNDHWSKGGEIDGEEDKKSIERIMAKRTEFYHLEIRGKV